MMLYKMLFTTVAVSTAATALAAETKTSQGSPLIDGVIACQNITDTQQRLACFDSSVAKLKTATDERHVVVLDREEVRKTRRSLFGFAFPDLPNIFGGNAKEDDEPEFSQLESVIANTSLLMPGKWIMVLADGATWQFAEINRRTEPRRGDKILIKRGPLGGYMAKIDGQTAVRVERIR